MENQLPTNDKNSGKEVTKTETNNLNMQEPSAVNQKVSKIIDKSKTSSDIKPKPNPKPPKLEDKPFDEFINKHLIPGLKSSIEDKGTLVSEIKLIEGERPVVGGKCWMVFCEMSEQRKFWLCFNSEIITSAKTILLAESDSDPSIVESFLIDEKKTTLPLLISRVLQRLNGQKWVGAN